MHEKHDTNRRRVCQRAEIWGKINYKTEDNPRITVEGSFDSKVCKESIESNHNRNFSNLGVLGDLQPNMVISAKNTFSNIFLLKIVCNKLF